MSITVTELLERYAAGERNFSGINLSGAHLEGVQIYDGIFIECNLSLEKVINNV
ncbi:MAG: hypothetical protein AAGF83_16065 [Cyanobacteria bacterium P01_G01_bin.67]